MTKDSFKNMAATLLSRITGLYRVTLINFIFGAAALTDCYNSAFKITNFFRQLLGEGALGAVFIPVYNEKEKKEGTDEAKKLIYSVMNIVLIFTMAVSILMIIFSVYIIELTVMGYSAENKKLTVALFNIMAFYFVFVGLGSMLSAVLNNFRQFFMPAFMSVMFNIALIVFMLFFSKNMGIYSLAWGTLVGGILEFLILVPGFAKAVKGYSLRIDWKDPYLRKMAIMLVPMLIGIMARQVNLLVDTFYASFLQEGSLSAINNATFIYNLPLGVFGISVATVIFPIMSKSYENGDMASVKIQIEKGLKNLVYFIIPSIIVLTVFSKETVKLLLDYGKFSDTALKITSETLAFYSLGLYFYCGVYLLSRCFYVAKNTKDPVRFSIMSIVLNTLITTAVVFFWKHIGIAVSFTISAGINFIQLYFNYNRKYIRLDTKGLLKYLVLIIGISGICAAIVFFIGNLIIKFIIFALLYFGMTFPIILRDEDIKRKIKRILKL